MKKWNHYGAASGAQAAESGKERSVSVSIGKKIHLKDQYKKWAFFFIFANLVLFLVFFLWPAVLGVYYSLTDYTGISAEFIGWENYIRLFEDPGFYKAILKTFKYTLVGVPLLYVFSLAVSILLASKYTIGKTLAKSIFFFPWLVSPIVAGISFRWLFGESFGFINYVLQETGVDPIKWFSDGDMAFIVIIIASIWMGTAFNMLLFLSALVNIPQTLYDAAEIDGANGWQKFRYITLPSLKPTSFMVILISTIHFMKEFAMVQSLTNGGPGTDNTFLVQYIYQTGFDKRDIGYASAVSVILFFILLIVSILQLRMEERVND